MKQPHRHTGAPGALIVSITHEPTRGERAPRDCQVFRSRSPDSGQPEPLQIHSESTGRAVFPQLPPLGPAEEQKPLSSKRESLSPRLSPCGIPRMLPCRLRPSWEVVLLRPILHGCESIHMYISRASQPNPSRFSPAPCELAGLVGSQRLEQRTSRPVICDHSFQPQSDARRTAIEGVTVIPVTGGPISQADCPSARSQSIGRGPA